MKICFSNSSNYDKQKKADEDLPSAFVRACRTAGLRWGSLLSVALILTHLQSYKIFLE